MNQNPEQLKYDDNGTAPNIDIEFTRDPEQLNTEEWEKEFDKQFVTPAIWGKGNGSIEHQTFPEKIKSFISNLLTKERERWNDSHLQLITTKRLLELNGASKEHDRIIDLIENTGGILSKFADSPQNDGIYINRADIISAIKKPPL